MLNQAMLMAGCSILGWLLVESLQLFARPGVRVTSGMNLLGAIAGALISGGLVLC